MRPIYIKLVSTDGGKEADCFLKGEPEGCVKIRFPDGREVVEIIDDLPSSWIEQLRKWNVFGRSL